MRALIILVACSLSLFGESFPPAEVKILGDIEYGQTSAPLDCAGQPRYCALVFNGHSGDRVEVDVKGGDGKAFVAFADGSLTELARGAAHLRVTLPGTGEDPITYYIVFSDSKHKPAQFTVSLKKVGQQTTL